MPAQSEKALCDRLDIAKKDRTTFETDVLGFVRKTLRARPEEGNFDRSLVLETARKFISERGGLYFRSSRGGALQQSDGNQKNDEILTDLIEIWSERPMGNKQKGDPTYTGNNASKTKKSTTKSTASRILKGKAKALGTEKPASAKNSPQVPLPTADAAEGPSNLSRRGIEPLIIPDDPEDGLPEAWDLINGPKQPSRHRENTRQALPAEDPLSDQTVAAQCPDLGVGENADFAGTSTPFVRVVPPPVLTPPPSTVRDKAAVLENPASVQEQQAVRCDTPITPTPIHVVSSTVMPSARPSSSALPTQLSNIPPSSNRGKRPISEPDDADDVTVHAQQSHTNSPWEESSPKRIRLTDVDPVTHRNSAQPQRGPTSPEEHLASADPAISYPELSPFVPTSHFAAQSVEIHTSNDVERSILSPADTLTSTLLAYIEQVQERMLSYTRLDISLEKIEEAKTRSKFLTLLRADLQSRVKDAATGSNGGNGELCSELCLWL